MVDSGFDLFINQTEREIIMQNSEKYGPAWDMEKQKLLAEERAVAINEREQKKIKATKGKIREVAEKIVNSCETEEDYLEALYKIKELDLSQEMIEEYKVELERRIEGKHSEEYKVFANAATSISVLVEGLKIIGELVVMTAAISGVLIWLKWWWLLVILALFFIVMISNIFKDEPDGIGLAKYFTQYDSRLVKNGYKCFKVLRKYEKKGYFKKDYWRNRMAKERGVWRDERLH